MAASPWIVQKKTSVPASVGVKVAWKLPPLARSPLSVRPVIVKV